MSNRISQMTAAAPLSGAELVVVSQLSATITLTATTISAQASDNSYNDSANGFVAAGFSVGKAVKVAGFTGSGANNILSGVVTAVTAGKLTIGGTDGDVIVDDAAGESVTITQWDTVRSTAQGVADLGGGGGSMPGAGYAQYLAAMLEPDAIEPIQRDAFTYVVGLGETKMLLASWQTRLGASGRMEQRNPQRPFALRNTTLSGIAGSSTALLLDPSLPEYGDPWATYYERLQQIAELPTRNVALTAVSQKKPFLPGAYGAIITQYTCFDFAWLSLRLEYAANYGINLWDEISDSASQRIGDSLALPISKTVACEVWASSFATGSPLGAVSFVLLPSDWSAIADPLTYTFRDDFMGATLDTGVWSRVQSTAGNVEIDPTYQWCTMYGNGSWGANGLFRTATESRAEGRAMIVDVYCPSGSAATGIGMVGWSDGAGHSYLNMAHAVQFYTSDGVGHLGVWESGVNRGEVGGPGWVDGCIYRVRIVLHADGSATYSMQGGDAYPPIGSAAWQDITPATSYSPDNTLTPGATASAGTAYIGDVRVVG